MKFKRLWNSIYLRNIAYATVTIVLLIFLSSIFLSIYTRHGESSPVPNFIGMSPDSLQIQARKAHLRVEISDSVFIFGHPRGTVFDQNPSPGFPVKKNRKIFITMNSMEQRKESVPRLTGMSLRQAKAELTSKGFRAGKLVYVSDMATNSVLQQMFQGNVVEPGVQLPVGSEIDLRLGMDSTSVGGLRVPNVGGLTLNNAKDILIENSLNNKAVFDKNILTYNDSINSVVYKQEPERNALSNYGGTVTIYLKPGKTK